MTYHQDVRAVLEPVGRWLATLAVCIAVAACGGNDGDRRGASRGGGGGTATSGTTVTNSGNESADVSGDDGNTNRQDEVDDLSDDEFEDIGGASTAGDADNDNNTVNRDTASAPPPDPETETMHALQFTTDPGNAVVTLRNVETGERIDGTTPASFEVPPGMYMWTVRKDGYLRQRSAQSVDLQTQQQERVSVQLQRASADGNYADLGDRAYQNGNVDQAIRYYEQVPEPGPQQDDAYYLRAKVRLGELYWQELDNPENAIEAYEDVVEQDPTRYEAYLSLARLSYDINRYDDAQQYLDEVTNMKYQIPKDQRFKTTLEVKYLNAVVLYDKAQEASTTAQKRLNAQKALTALRGFVNTVPSDLESDFRQQIQDANTKQNELRSLLRTIR